ncbi:MAG TPA: hypothetical protein VEJ38_05940 [Candidatus Acidoferrales bacterium]|nr:hypothetical protein [Candidatus Acidoferrales bacterium]
MKGEKPGSSSGAARLNEYQARRLRVTFAYIDRLLCEIEGILNASESQAAFPRYEGEVTSQQRETIQDYVARLRSKLVRVLEGQGIRREGASIHALHAIHVALGSIDIAVEELKPRYMRGYGEVPEAAAAELSEIVENLCGLVAEFDQYVRKVDREGVGHAAKGDPE